MEVEEGREVGREEKNPYNHERSTLFIQIFSLREGTREGEKRGREGR